MGSVSAQEKGDMAAGLNIGFAPCLQSGVSLTNFSIGAKYQYNVTTPIRLEAALEYGFKSKGVDVFDIAANVHYIFKIKERFNIYPTIGIGYAHVGGGFSGDFGDVGDIFEGLYDFFSGNYGADMSDVDEMGSSSSNKFLFNIGVGAEYSINDNLSVGAEIKYQFIKDFSRLPINVGVTYRF